MTNVVNAIEVRDLAKRIGKARRLVITVADTGSGMSADIRRRAFDAFYTTKGIGGTGLGLWVSKEIMDRHKGTLRFRSSVRPERKGTVYLLFLPFVAAVR